MADRFDLDAIEADDALLDLLAAGGESARVAGEHDPALMLLADLRLAVEVEDELPVETIDDPESFLARCAALNPVTDPFARKLAARGLALGVAAVAALSVSGVAAAVTGDPLSPYEEVIKKVVDGLRPETSFPKEQLDGMPVVDKTKIVKVAKNYKEKQEQAKADEDEERDPFGLVHPPADVDQPKPPLARPVPPPQVDKPVEKQLAIEPPVVKPSDPPQQKPADDQTDEPEEKPVDDPTDEPTDEPTEPPVSPPPAEPTEETTPTPTPTPTQTTDPTTEPTDQPTNGSDNGEIGEPTAPTSGENPTGSPTTPPGTGEGSTGNGTTSDGAGTDGDQTKPSDPPTSEPSDPSTSQPADDAGEKPGTGGQLPLLPVLPEPTGEPTLSARASQYFGLGHKTAAKHSSGKGSVGYANAQYAKGKHSTGKYAEGRHAAFARAHGSMAPVTLRQILAVLNTPMPG